MAVLSASGEFFEHFLACSANGAVPVIGEVFKGSARRNLALAVSFFRPVDIAAVAYLALPHGHIAFAFSFFRSFEIGFGSAADRADPVFGNIFESGSRSDAGIGIANNRVVFIPAEADILLHDYP